MQWDGYAQLDNRSYGKWLVMKSYSQRTAFRVGPRADFAFHNMPQAPPPAALSVTPFGMTVYAPLRPLTYELSGAIDALVVIGNHRLYRRE